MIKYRKKCNKDNGLRKKNVKHLVSFVFDDFEIFPCAKKSHFLTNSLDDFYSCHYNYGQVWNLN